MTTTDVMKYLKPGAIVPVDVQTTALLVNALREALASQGEALASEAIEQPAQQEPDDKHVIELATRYGLDHSMIGALRNFADAYNGTSLSWQKIDLSEDQLQRLTTKASFIPGLVMDSSPPAQRTWVNATTWRGLTDREIDELWMSHHDDFGNPLSATGYERAIEAKLKEKNCG